MMDDQKILDNAPDWADTHRKILNYPDCTTYIDNKYEDRLDRSLADIKELVELRNEKAELKKTIKELTDGVTHFNRSRGDINPLLEAYIKALKDSK